MSDPRPAGHLSCAKHGPKRREETTPGEDGSVESSPLARSSSQSVYDLGATDCASQRRSPFHRLTVPRSHLYRRLGHAPFSSAYLVVPSIQLLFLASRTVASMLYMGVRVDEVGSGSTHGGCARRLGDVFWPRARPAFIIRMEAFPKNEMDTAIRHSARQQGPPSWYPRLKLPQTWCAVSSTAHTSTTEAQQGSVLRYSTPCRVAAYGLWMELRIGGGATCCARSRVGGTSGSDVHLV